VGGLVSLPAWANGWSPETLPTRSSLLNTAQEALLAEVVETIIPKTDTPGAKELGIHQFVQTMVKDCFEKQAQETLANGLTTVDDLAKQRYGKSFAAADTAQRTELLGSFSQSTDPAQKGFLQLVKGLTIRGYMTSEYVMTNLTKFQFAPGYYHGCVPVVAKAVTEKK